MVNVFVLRLGHRIARDKRISTHVGLVARTFGARGIYYTGQKDSSLEESINKIVENWGGPFKVEYLKSWRKFLREFNGLKIHLTMYGLPFQEEITKIQKSKKDLLIIIGGQKVPWEIYEIADFNLAVTNQPHSEVSALAVFLDHYFKEKELNKKFENAKKYIKPQPQGKQVIER